MNKQTDWKPSTIALMEAYGDNPADFPYEPACITKNNEMNANELRIGNFVYDDEGALVILKSISDLTERWQDEEESKRVMFDKFINSKADGYYDCDYDQLTPIELTETWLIKAGFEKYLNGDYYRLKEELCVEAWSDKFSIYLPYFHLETYTGRITLKYVHQLQNLYFALTRTELPFTA
jgi:hypothetical protein